MSPRAVGQVYPCATATAREPATTASPNPASTPGCYSGTTGAQSHTGMKTMVSTAGSGLSSIPARPHALLRGAKAGPWVVERELGRGGMGTVYAVVHEEIGKRAALKIVHQHLLAPGF